MPVSTVGWTNGGWNNKLHQFHLLAEMLGVNTTSISPDDLQTLFHRVASAKAFADNTQAFIDAATDSNKSAADRVEAIERRLGLTEPLPFMSMQGSAVPDEFNGVAIWPTGITNWTKLRLEQILLAMEAGARFKRIVCMSSSRVCGTPADRRHPLIKNIEPGQEPTEQALQRRLVRELMRTADLDPSIFRFAELPEKNEAGRPLTLEQQLIHLKETKQYDDLIGGEEIYVPSTPNSLFVPLYVRRVLGHDNVWFSQAGARLVRKMPTDFWWPSLQDVMTLPNGMIRLWVELVEAGCITR